LRGGLPGGRDPGGGALTASAWRPLCRQT
jgi:hypothetical protein